MGFVNLLKKILRRGPSLKDVDVTIGKYTYGIPWDYSNVRRAKIGSFCSIAKGASIGIMNHPMHFVSTHPFLYYKNRGFVPEDRNLPSAPYTVIEDDVWIGLNAIVMPGVTVHKGAIVGGGAVVTKDVPPYAIAVGVPARVIKYRFDEDTIRRLCAVDWADWPDELIKERIELFYDPLAFLEYAESNKS